MALIGGYLNLELTRMDGVRTHLSCLLFFFIVFANHSRHYRSMAQMLPLKPIHLTQGTPLHPRLAASSLAQLVLVVGEHMQIFGRTWLPPVFLLP